MHALSQLLRALQLEANVFHNGQYCGMWAVDTSGKGEMSFHVVTHGSCHLLIEEESIELFAGDAVFMPSDAQHRISSEVSSEVPVNVEMSVSMQDLVPNGTGLVCGNFGNANPIFKKIADQLPSYLIIRREENSAGSQIIDLLLNESKSSGQSSNLLLNRLADCLLFVMLRDSVHIDDGLFAALAHPKLGKAFDLIHTDNSERVSVEDLAAAAGMSRSAYSALFKEMVQQSPADYQTHWRMTNAWQWLANEGISTLEAALRSGYETEASFSKAFKRVMGIGPGKVRAGLQAA